MSEPGVARSLDGLPAYGAVVLYYRRGPAVLDTIAALREQLVPPRHVVLVDNHSGDGVVDELVAAGKLNGVQVISSETNLGYAGGMNAGARAVASSCGYLLFATHEVRMDPDCVLELLTAAVGSDASVVGPRLELPDGATWSLGGLVDWKGDVAHRLTSATTEPILSSWLDGSCLLVARSEYNSVGGFDPRYFLYWEDVDFCLSMRDQGPVLCVPRAHARQSPGNPPLDLMLRNRLLLWRKRRDAPRMIFTMLEYLARLARRLPRVTDPVVRREIHIFCNVLRGRPASREAT